jgi:hypothetical protein
MPFRSDLKDITVNKAIIDVTNVTDIKDWLFTKAAKPMLHRSMFFFNGEFLRMNMDKDMDMDTDKNTDKNTDMDRTHIWARTWARI